MWKRLLPRTEFLIVSLLCFGPFAGRSIVELMERKTLLLVAALTILPLGLVFAMVYWRWRLVWPLIVAHGVMDFMGLMPEVP
jgi:membrane protease YdiL (CAAX protease family)